VRVAPEERAEETVVQKTTEEFSHRLGLALEGHPRAPGNVHGRQSWLRRVLKEQTGRSVSANTVHKWCRGTARPRPDALRDLARVLNVDEVWLSLGRKPTSEIASPGKNAAAAGGATMLVAGLIEISGGRVSFPAPGDGVVTLWANIGDVSIGLLTVFPQNSDDGPVFIIPEPVGDSRIIGVIPRHQTDGCTSTACVDLIDLTDVPRENLGGFSLIRLASRKDGRFKAEGQRSLLRPMKSIEELGESAS